MSKTLTENQLRAMEIIRFFREDPKRWTQMVDACKQDGSDCSARDKEAVSFCFIGAVIALYGIAAADALTKEAINKKGACIFSVNDDAKSLDEMIAGVSWVFDLP